MQKKKLKISKATVRKLTADIDLHAGVPNTYFRWMCGTEPPPYTGRPVTDCFAK
jgi:hypothetical protein